MFPRRRFTIFASYIWHNPFLTHPHVWTRFLQFFYLLASSPWLCRTHAFVLLLKMELSPSKPAIPWAPERLKVSLVSWSSISWSRCRCSTQREVLVLLGLCPSCSGKSSRNQIQQPYKHISRFRTYSPGCLSVLSNRKCHFFNLPCSEQRAVAAQWYWNQWKWFSAGSFQPLRGQH